MSETISLIDNTIFLTVKPNDREIPDDGSLESSSPIHNSPFRKIEFRLARKPFANGGGFQLGGLNTTTANSNKIHNDQHRVAFEPLSGGSLSKKRDASELDPENRFGITFRRIGAGLENLGNTCFLNSVLQCLTYTEPLAAYLQSGRHQITCRNAGFCALCAIQKHVSRALQSSGKSLAPKDLVSNLRYISHTFRSSRQEDTHEYMVNLLESMHKCCLPSGVPSESPCAYERSLVHNIFGGQLRSQVKCMQCNYCSNKFDPFLDLSLEILKADTLYKAFADFTTKEQLDGGAKQYQCEQCKQKVKALKQLTIHEAPNVLTVHLKRFGSHMSGQKIDKKVHFSPTLDLKPFVTGPFDSDLKYTLYGVLVHAGWSTHSGHYYCFVRTSSGMWYSLDDHQVIQVSEKKVFEQKAYMLFYFRDRKNFPSKKPVDDVCKKERVVNEEAFLTMLQEREDKRSTHEDVSDPVATVTICSKPERAPGGSAYVNEDVAPGKSYGGDDSSMESSSLLKMETFSIDKKVLGQKRCKKIKKNHLKMKVTSMKICLDILLGASLNQRKKKKHKRTVKDKLPIKNIDIKGMKLGSKIQDKSSKISVKCNENEFKKRIYGDGAVLRCKKELVHLLTEDRTVPRWDENESSRSLFIKETHDVPSIGYVGDEWDEEYDQAKRKKRRGGLCSEFDGRNPFQDIANERLNSDAGERNRLRKKHRKQPERSSSGDGPFRI